MAHVPLCALVYDETPLDPRHIAAAARACLSDVRKVVARHGFDRTANGLLLAVLSIEEDLDEVVRRELEGIQAAE